jgi:Xaa-Pro dipeptidase
MEGNAASRYINASKCVDLIRARKDEKELDLMRAASLLNDRAMEEIQGFIHEGVTEKELAEAVSGIYKRLGTEGVSFETLIGFGANAADGHHAPDDTKLREGDAVLIDMGCIKDGYCSDMTRTFFFRSVSDRMKAVYNLVKTANEEARAKIRPGVPLRDIDGIARKIISDAGYGKYFTHRLGHFIGIEVHEFGDVSGASEIIAEPGMVFSIEPGIYLPQEGGVRIEDLVIVTETGCETLNHVPRELKII